jgi:uncharacterized protein YegP (UPF0339 family)
VAKAWFAYHQNNAGQWRWRFHAMNGQLLVNGDEGFASKANVLRSLKAMRKAVAMAGDPVEVER